LNIPPLMRIDQYTMKKLVLILTVGAFVLGSAVQAGEVQACGKEKAACCEKQQAACADQAACPAKDQAACPVTGKVAKDKTAQAKSGKAKTVKAKDKKAKSSDQALAK